MSQMETNPRSGGTLNRRGGRLLRTSGLAAVAAVVALAVSACGGSSSSSGTQTTSYGTKLFGSLPAVGTSSNGGTITIGLLSGSTPNFIFPLADCTHTSAYNSNLTAQLWEPLYNGPEGARPQYDPKISLASGAPVASDGGKTFTIHLQSGYRWSNGAPVDAQDVLFDIDLLKAALKESSSNWCQSVPGQFPQDVVSATAPNATTVVIKLNKAYNPSYFLNNQLQDTNYGVLPLPSTDWNIASANGPHLDFSNPANAAKIYNYLYKQGEAVSGFASSPLWKDVDGPFALKDFDVTNGSYDLEANPKYGGAVKPRFSVLSEIAYTSWAAELNAIKSGQLDIAIQADASVIPQAAALKRQGYSLFGGPTWGYSPGYFNFHDKTDSFENIIKQPYAREALFELEDQPGIIKGILKGAGVPQYGTVPSAPLSTFTPKDSVTPLYPYNPKAAVALLRDHGWNVVPNGQSTCAKPGNGADECGAGIAKGTPFKGVWLDLPASVTPAASLTSETIVSEAKQTAGIDFAIHTVSFNLSENYNDAAPQGAQYENDWAVNATESFDTDYYPTAEGSFNTVGPFNTGGFSDPQADKLMTDSVYSPDPTAVITEASYLARNPPALFLPGGDELALVSSKVGGPANSFLSLTYVATEPQYWYVTK